MNHTRVKNADGDNQGDSRSSKASEALYRSLFEYSPDGILIADSDGFYLDANPSVCEMLGYTREALIGLNATSIVATTEIQHISTALSSINANIDYQRQWQFRRKDDTIFDAEVKATLMPDGNVLAIVRDVTAIKANEHEIAQLSKLYAASSQVNQAIVWASTREELLQKTCQKLVEHGGFSMAWVGWHDPETHLLEPVANWGDIHGYIQKIKVYADDRPQGHGPCGLAFRTGQPYICNYLQTDPAGFLWRDEQVKRNYHAVAAFPIRQKGIVCGSLAVYADSKFYFSEKEILLLEEATLNISFALDNLLREKERKEAEVFAKNEKLFSDTLIESMPGVLYVYDIKGKFLRWNKSFEVVSGYSSQEIEKMNPLDFFSLEEKQFVSERIADVFSMGESSVEASFVAKDGRAYPYFFTGKKVILNGIECLVGMGIDVSERKLAEARLGDSVRKYRELVELANSIILRWDADGKISFLNKFGQRFFGYTLEEIVGRHVMHTIVPDMDSDGHDLNKLIGDICAEPEKFERNINQNIKRNGERVWIAWTNTFARDGDGKIIEILSVGTDISEQRNAEEAVLELNATLEQRVIDRTTELNSAVIRAEAADKIKSAFLATMSHELRTPLNSIIGFTGIILHELAGPINQEQSKQLEMVQDSARHLLELINDVLDISKIEAGQLEVHLEPFDLRASIDRVVKLIKPVLDKKALKFTTVIHPQIDEMVNDRRRLEQILINLLNNAIKFTERGSVTLCVDIIDDYVAPTGRIEQSAVRFRVKDTGIGIKRDNFVRLFQPFIQIDSGMTRHYDGTGLGLAICQKLCSMMGGEISGDSEWMRGSVFTVVIPLNK